MSLLPVPGQVVRFVTPNGNEEFRRAPETGIQDWLDHWCRVFSSNWCFAGPVDVPVMERFFTYPELKDAERIMKEIATGPTVTILPAPTLLPKSDPQNPTA